MASVFRGMLFWKSDNVQIAADHGELNDTVTRTKERACDPCI